MRQDTLKIYTMLVCVGLAQACPQIVQNRATILTCCDLIDLCYRYTHVHLTMSLCWGDNQYMHNCTIVFSDRGGRTWGHVVSVLWRHSKGRNLEYKLQRRLCGMTLRAHQFLLLCGLRLPFSRFTTAANQWPSSHTLNFGGVTSWKQCWWKNYK